MKLSRINQLYILPVALGIALASGPLRAQGVLPRTAPPSSVTPAVGSVAPEPSVATPVGSSGTTPIANVATAAAPGAAPAAWVYLPLSWAADGGSGGPVLSPDIVPLYWGKNANDWVAGDGQPDDDPNLINTYLDNFANYISGVNQPAGFEPVTKQYGVWGAERYGGTFTCNGSCSSGDGLVEDTGIQQRIQKLVNSGVLPPGTPNRLYVIFLKGFTYNFSSIGSNICGYHSLIGTGGPYYAVVPYELAAVKPDGSLLNCSFQSVLSHELFESMTDPYPNNGWSYYSGEGGDECQPWSGAGASGMTQFPWGFSQTFADNVTGTCSAFSWPTTSTIVASNWPRNGELVNAFFTSPNLPGGLVHAYTEDGVTWGWEQAGPSTSPIALVQAPAVPAIDNPAGDTQIHAFVRGAAAPAGNGTTGYLFHFSKTLGGSWNVSRLADSTVGQPSAVQTTLYNSDMDVVARSWDSSVVHYWSYDPSFSTFSSEDLSSQTIGPPTINLLRTASGSYNFGLYTYGEHADQVVNSGYTEAWSGFSTLEGGVYGMLPQLIGAGGIDSNHRIVFADGNGGYNANYPVRQNYLPRYTVDNNGWTSTYYNFGTATPFGAFAVISSAGGVDVSWQDRSTLGYWHWHFNATTHSWSQITNTSNWDPIQNLGGGFLNPPAMTYGTDGAVYILGVGFDDNLYVTKISGSTVSGPTWTGLVGIL